MIPKDGVISEVYHAKKWHRDIDRHFLSPMYDDGLRHYFIDELAQLKDGRFVVPLRWLEDVDGRIVADAWQVRLDESDVRNQPVYPCEMIENSHYHLSGQGHDH